MRLARRSRSSATSDAIASVSAQEVERERWISETLEKRLTYQSQSNERLEVKGGVLAGFVTLASQFLAQRHSALNAALFWTAIAWYGASLASVILTLLPRRTSWPPQPEPFLADARKKPLVDSLKKLNDRRVRAFKHNADILKWKGRFWVAGGACFVIATVSSVLGFMVGR